MSYRIFRTSDAILIEDSTQPESLRQASGFSFDTLFTSSDPLSYVREIWIAASPTDPAFNPADTTLLPPLGQQEVWAAGVTYFRSRTARMEEAEVAGGDSFYDRVYHAARPELFFKATAPRVRGHLAKVGIRFDSTWDVPEPEFTLAISADGKIFGYTIGNDMSSRSIEGENPLYLPQAKSYTGSAALGPCLVVGELPALETPVSIAITRSDQPAFVGETTLSQMKRSFTELAEWLFRCNHFPIGVCLMTGTGIVPGGDFTLREGDQIAISIGEAGTLLNTVETV